MFFELDDFPFLKPICSAHEMIGDELAISRQIAGQANPLATATRFWLDGGLDQDVVAPPSPIVDDWVQDGGFHPDQIGYDSRGGRWATLPLFSAEKPALTSVSTRFFPETMRLLDGVPRLNFSAFFRLAPGAQVLEHQHRHRNLIFHLVLADLGSDESSIVCDGSSRRTACAGDWALFDYSRPHSSFNRTDHSRINLIIDFTPDPDVLARHDSDALTGSPS